MKLSTGILLLVGGVFISSSCNSKGSDKFEKNPNGLEYKYITKGKGTVTPKVGDVGEISVIFKIGDSVMINTNQMNENKPVTQAFQTPQMKGDLMEGLLMMKAGDSIVFRMNMDTLAARSKQPKPEWAKPGDYASWAVKMFDIKTAEQVKKETVEKNSVQGKKDDATLLAYFKEKGITNFKKTASGLYYVLHKDGVGAAPANGQQVTVNYTGMDLEGKKFDSNVDPEFKHVEPFTFGLGNHQVIAGWDEAVALLKKGGSATFYIPSSLAYGEHGAPPRIEPNAILIFDIELVDFK